MNTVYLNNTLKILALFILTFAILFFGKAVLVPLTFGAVLAMLLLPVCRWLQRRGLGNGLASALSIVGLLLVIAAIIALLQYQISGLGEDLSKIEERVTTLISGVKDYVKQHFGISHREQQKIIKEQQSGGMEKAAGMVTTLAGSLAGIMVDAILVLVYTFLFIYFRSHFKKFILRLVDRENTGNAQTVLT
jgi:predicted PurR-regulated permease PerM